MTYRCEECLENIAAYEDGEMQAQERAAFEAHLAQCASCRWETQAQALVRKRLGDLERSNSDVPLPPHIWTNATHAWQRHDARYARRLTACLTLLGICLLVEFGLVSAHLRQQPAVLAVRTDTNIRKASVVPASHLPMLAQAGHTLDVSR
jgi:anti-sigma factor RsiW